MQRLTGRLSCLLLSSAYGMTYRATRPILEVRIINIGPLFAVE
jgi:hypothetical protein